MRVTSINAVLLGTAVPALAAPFWKNETCVPVPQVPDSCTGKDVLIRKDWDAFQDREKEAYIAATACMLSLPALTPRDVAPGARTRMDDFTVAHINQTTAVHFSGWILPWHRYFVSLYEKALREECGYSGAQPYWDWTKHSDDITKTPLFDGSRLSIGSNGVVAPDRVTVGGAVPGVPEPQILSLTPGTGGGCVTDMPWGNGSITLNLGPIFPYGPQEITYESMPHCLTRDFRPEEAAKLNTSSVEALLASPDLGSFRQYLDTTGLHLSGHAAVGGDETDIFTSPNDPVFYLHHAQIDRLWALWQDIDKEGRVNQVEGTRTWNNSPPSPNVSLDDMLEFGVLGRARLGDVVDPTSGKLCYKYV